MAGLTTGMKGVTVYVTVPDRSAAEQLARALVNERLAACVNIIPGVRSVYRWQGDLQCDDEVLLLAKTRADLATRLCERVAEWHSYDVPCAVVLPWEDALPAYAQWVEEQTGEAPDGGDAG